MHVKSKISQGSMSAKRNVNKEKARFFGYLRTAEKARLKNGGRK